jgi:hypothetical protein
MLYQKSLCRRPRNCPWTAGGGYPAIFLCVIALEAFTFLSVRKKKYSYEQVIHSSRHLPWSRRFRNTYLLSAKKIKSESEEIVVLCKSIVMARLKSHWITSYWPSLLIEHFCPQFAHYGFLYQIVDHNST